MYSKNNWGRFSRKIGNMSKIIGIIGSRRKNSPEYKQLIIDELNKIWEDGDKIVSGGCPYGADRFAEEIAKIYGKTIIIHYTDWIKIGKSACFIRNNKIAEDADVLIAVVSDDRTGGTEDTIKKYLKLCKKDLILIQ